MKTNLDSVVLRLKRPDTPLFKAARRVIDFCLKATIPVPRALKPAGRLFYEARFYLPILWKRFKALVYTTPNVHGQTLLYIGDDVRFSGDFAITSGRFGNRPTLRIGDRAFIGHNVSITCNREVVIENDVLIAASCRISDYDGHSSSLEKRICNSLPDLEEMQPVRICKGAWVGYGVSILKGVTVGEGAIVGANSVVTHNVPPYSVAAGSPAKVVKYLQAPISVGTPMPVGTTIPMSVGQPICAAA